MTTSIRILVLIFLAVCAYPAQAQHSQWENDIRAFEAADRAQSPPRDAVLFVGSSSIRMWESLDDDFPNVPIISRGFGGSEISDVIHFANRIVVPYEPSMIVLYAGDNDIAAGKTAEEVFADYRRFVRMVRAELPETRIAFISIKPSLARWHLAPEMKEANDLIRGYSTDREGLEFIDIYAPMLNEEGKPREELFLEDGLHLSAQGYALWARAVKPFLPKKER